VATPKAGGKSRQNQAPRRAGGAARPAQANGPMPTWHALLIGAGAGVIMGGLLISVYWMSQDKECPPPPEVEECPDARLVAPPATKQRAGEDFYSVLPRAGVKVIQDQDEKIDPYIYHLQTGSFKNVNDAGQQQADLALDGFVATVAPYLAPSGTTWHRVRVGPFTSKREAGKVKREIWERSKIDATRLQQKAP
jgi:hypothetical protein